MTLKGNEMTIQRGESFTIDRSVVNRDNSPFIISSEYANPYILITVASAKYNQDNRYIANWWLNVDTLYDEDGNLIKLPRFKYTRPVQISAFDVTQVIGDMPGEYLYYVDDVTKCKYFDEDNVWHDYDFRIIHHFGHNVTKDWIEQTYSYSIRLVSGYDMSDYIRNLYKAVYNTDEVPADWTNEEFYNKIKAVNESYVKDLVISRPIVSMDVVTDILLPTKLTVLSDLNGGLK